MVESSFKKCALTIDDNGEDDEQISCFKPGKPCAERYKVLKEQMTIFSEQQNTANAFEITDSSFLVIFYLMMRKMMSTLNKKQN